MVTKMMNSPFHQVYCALIDEKVIGTITISKQEQSTILSGFAVHPSYQGKGYGKIFLRPWYISLLQKEFQQLN